MNNFSEQLFNQELPQIVPGGQHMNGLKQPLPKNNSPNQASAFTQNASTNGSPEPQNEQDKKRQRRSKHVQDGRDFKCDCGKSYLSQPALNNHIKIKHPERFEGQKKKGRGIPIKYPKSTNSDFENTKYVIFFEQSGRRPDDEKSFDIEPLVKEVFSFIYEAPTSNELFSKPINFNDVPVLSNLVSRNKAENIKTCDDAFSEYLISFMGKTNRKYFSLMLKLILLFKECYDISKNKDKKEEEKQAVTNSLSPQELPDLCNEFFAFLEQNGFFGITEAGEENEIVEIILHFCTWLFKRGYTSSKLSLAS